MTQTTPGGGKARRGTRRRHAPGGLTAAGDGEQLGRDYVVSYATSPYQNGTLVLRFATEPGRTDLIDAVTGYGVPEREISEISARPVPSLAERQASREDSSSRASGGVVEPAARRTAPPRTGSPSPHTGSPGAGSRGGTGTGRAIGGVLGLIVVVFLGLSVLNLGAFSEGRTMGGHYPDTGEDRLGYCTRMIETLAPADQGLFGQLFSDSPTAFPVTPPNAAYLVGCATG